MKVSDEMMEAALDAKFQNSSVLRFLNPNGNLSEYEVLGIMRAALEAALASQPQEGEADRQFKLGDRVTKLKGSSWTGHVVGFYSTELNPKGVCVESENEPGSVQIYPETALAGFMTEGELKSAIAALAHPPTDTPQAGAPETEGHFEAVEELHPEGDNFHTSIYEHDYKGLLVARCNQNGNYPDQVRLILNGLNGKSEAADRIEQLERERDEARTAEDEAKDCFWAIYPAWCELKGRGINAEAARTKLAERAQSAEARLAEALKALSWYAEKVAGCSKLGTLGIVSMHELHADGGRRARAIVEGE